MAPTPRDRAFLDRLHEVVTRRQQQAGRAAGKAAEQSRWDIDGSVVIGRIDTAERRVYIGTRHIATPDDGVLVEDQHAPDVRRLWHHTSAMHPDEVLLKRRLEVDGWEIVGAETVFDFRTPAVVDAADVDHEAAAGAPAPASGAARPATEETAAPGPPATEPTAAAEPTAPAQPAAAEPTAPAQPAAGVTDAPAAEEPGAQEDARLLAAGPRVAGLQETQAHVTALLRAATAAVLSGEAVADDAISALQQWNDDLAALALAVGLPATAGLAEVDAAVQAASARDQARRRAELVDAMALLDGLIDRFPFAAERLKDARDAMTAEYEEAQST